MSKSLYLNKNRILLSNLINIRWIAIFGQLFAILFVYFILKIPIPILTCLIVVIISIIINFYSFINKQGNNYLNDNEAFYFLLYDIIQLAVLLYLTGGIYNPFSILILAPVIISSSYLKINFSIFLLFLSILIIILISFFYIEIQWPENFIFPIFFIYGIISALIISLIFISTYVYTLARSSREISDALNQTQIALVNQKKISEVGSLTAAAVHELSTPLNTIFLILDDIKKDNNILKDKNLKSEIDLLESQANRCKKILYNLSKNPPNIIDNYFDKITLSNLVKINFEKFKKDNIELEIKSKDEKLEPEIKFSDEIMYGVGNIMQNAIDHANNKIEIDIKANNTSVILKIIDDGKGFTKEVLDKIGNPFISENKDTKNMGLGIFIAKNLIESVGGKIKFYNNSLESGSVVEIYLKKNN